MKIKIDFDNKIIQVGDTPPVSFVDYWSDFHCPKNSHELINEGYIDHFCKIDTEEAISVSVIENGNMLVFPNSELNPAPYRNAGRKKGSRNKEEKEKTITQRFYKKTFDKVNENRRDFEFKEFLDLAVNAGIEEINKKIKK